MNIFKLTILSLLFFTNCSKQKTEKKASKDEIKQTIDSILTQWHKAAADANYETYMGTMDPNSIFIGTDATEYWTKEQFEAFSKPYFDEGNAWDFKLLKRNIFISKSNDIVWFDETLNTWMGTCIGSGVFEKNNDQWKMKHYTLSIAAPNDALDTIIKVKRKTDSIYLNKFNAKPISTDEFVLQ